jgi:hypothetical protein
MPEITRVLVTPDDYSGVNVDGYEEIIHVDLANTGYWFLDSLYYLEYATHVLKAHGYDRALFLDADTYICEPVYELYDLLEVFEVVAAHAPARFTTKSAYNLPVAFPELNVGVMLFWLYDIGGFVLDWKERYQEDKELYKNNDQGSLRDILWKTCKGDFDFRYHIIPPEYNCRFNFDCFIATDPKILHGKSENYEQTLAKIKAIGRRMRSWKQGEVNYP